MSEPAREQSPVPSSPYPGLRPFRQDEAKLFFGRDAQIDDVLARLKRHQFLGVVGTSGCGKSSLIRAGVLPALESGLMGELGSSWFIADMKPGDAPLTNLAVGLMRSGVLGDRWSNTSEGIALLTATLRRSDVSLVNLIQHIGLPKYTNLLVLADQFEEIFRFQQSDPNEALAFVNLLLETGRDRLASIYVVLTMRSDYLGPCALFPGLPEALNDAQYLCPRLTRDQLAEAIEGPATLFGGEVERALVTQIVNDAGANSDQLPLVQHVLARIWHARPQDGRGSNPESAQIVLRLKDYQDRGGLSGCSASSLVSPISLEGVERSGVRYGIGPGCSYRQNALSEHADEAYLSLGDSSHESRSGGPDHKPSRKQMIAQMLFRCLAERGPSGQYVRRPMKVQDVAAIAGCSDAEVIEVVEVFRREDRSFLVPPVGVRLDADSVLDISHEALIRQWHRFGGQGDQPDGTDSSQSWLAIEDQSRRRYRRLAEAADSEPNSGLLRDPELSFLHKWWQEFQPRDAWANGCVPASFSRTEVFLTNSLNQKAAEVLQAQEDSRRKEREDLERRELSQKAAYATTLQRFSAALFVVAALAVIGLCLAISASRDAARKSKLAEEALDEAKKARTSAEKQLRLNQELKASKNSLEQDLNRRTMGSDDRQRIVNTKALPCSAVCQMEMLSPNGAGMVGTATLISSRHILTAAYNVYSREEALGVGPMRDVSVFPGRNGDETPFGQAKVVEMRAMKQWLDNGDEQFAIAVAALDVPLGDKSGYLPLDSYKDAELTGALVSIVGFPADKTLYGSMWGVTGLILEPSPTQLMYSHFTSAGMGGAPLIYSREDGSPGLVVGVHAYNRGGLRSAIRISDEVLKFVHESLAK